MEKLKVFEAFVDDLWGLPVFNELTPEEDEKIGEMVNETLDEFQNTYFEMDEPSIAFNTDPDSIRADYWLVNDTVQALNILDRTEMANLEKLYPAKIRRIESTLHGKQRVHEYKSRIIYGQFLWYSIEDGKKRQYRVWMIGKDSDHLFRAVDAEYATYGRPNTILRSAWDNAKQYEDLDSLLASQVSHLKSIGKFIQKHCENEYDEIEQARREAEAEGDPNAGLEPWR